MRIALDLRWVNLHVLDGISRVSLCVTAEVLQQPGAHQYILIFIDHAQKEFCLKFIRAHCRSALKADFQTWLLNCSPRALSNSWKLAIRLKQNKLDRYFSFYYIFSPLPCPAISMIHDLIPLLYPAYFNQASLAFRLTMTQAPLLKRIVSFSQAIVTVSENSKQDIQRLLGVSKDKIHVCYPAVSQALPVSGAPLQQQTDYILAVSRPDPHKNFAGLIQAYAGLNASLRARYSLYLAGPYDERYTPQLQAQISQLGLNDSVRLWGAVNAQELARLYTHATVFAMPSFYEGFGLPPLEAMSYGVPVIAGRSGAMPEVLADACLWVKPENPEDIQKALQILLEDPTLRLSLQKKGREQVARYTWARSAQKLLGILEMPL